MLEMRANPFRHLGLAEPTRPAAQFGLFGEGED
jgi:Holliday junction DNA helicase RuvB